MHTRFQQEAVTLRRADNSNKRYFGSGPRKVEQLQPSSAAPKFSSQLKNLQLTEGQHVMLDVKFSPTDDPNLKIAWLLNGKAILQSSRITTINEFGMAVLEINPVTVFDHGEYTVVAVNQLGEARQSAIVEVSGKCFCEISIFS